MEFHSPGNLHVVVSERSAGTRLQRFTVCAFREHLLGNQRIGSQVGPNAEEGGGSKHAVQVATKEGRLLVNGAPQQGRHVLSAGCTRPPALMGILTAAC